MSNTVHFLGIKACQEGTSKPAENRGLGKGEAPYKTAKFGRGYNNPFDNLPILAARSDTFSCGGDISMAISLSGLGNFPSNPRKVASLPIPVLIFLRKQPIRSQNLRKVAMAPLDKRSGGHGAKVIEIRQDRYPEYPIGQKGYCAG